MKHMKHFALLPAVLVGILLLSACSKYKYEEVKDDPM